MKPLAWGTVRGMAKSLVHAYFVVCIEYVLDEDAGDRCGRSYLQMRWVVPADILEKAENAGKTARLGWIKEEFKRTKKHLC